VTAVLFQGIGRERQMTQMTEIWRCRWLPFVAVAGWSSVGEWGSTVPDRSRNFPFHILPPGGKQQKLCQSTSP